MTPHEQVELKISQLREQLLADSPQLPTILSQIKMMLVKNEEVVTLLSEDQIAEVVNAAKHVSRIKLIEATVKSKTKKLKETELSDLM